MCDCVIFSKIPFDGAKKFLALVFRKGVKERLWFAVLERFDLKPMAILSACQLPFLIKAHATSWIDKGPTLLTHHHAHRTSHMNFQGFIVDWS